MTITVDRCFDWLGGLLLPPRCILCGGPGQRPCLDLCAGCEADLPAAAGPLAPDGLALRRSYAAFAYAPPLDHLVQSLKYRGQLAVGRVLGSLLGDRVATLGLHRAVDVVLPVPLHPQRHGARGFNQATEIGRWVARRLDLRLDPGLATRIRDTRPQVGLAVAQRHGNLAGAFAATTAARGLRIALLDDVTTTGRTLQELAAALDRAGAASVEAWCVARTGPATAASAQLRPAAEPA